MKLWNISDRKIDASHTFEEEPTSISLHPNGLYAAVAFPERVQMLSLLLDGFSHMHDLNIRAVNLVKFSGGGQFVACCAGAHHPPLSTPSSLCPLTSQSNSSLSLSLSLYRYGHPSVPYLLRHPTLLLKRAYQQDKSIRVATTRQGYHVCGSRGSILFLGYATHAREACDET